MTSGRRNAIQVGATAAAVVFFALLGDRTYLLAASAAFVVFALKALWWLRARPREAGPRP